jgi:hypothetical protein
VSDDELERVFWDATTCSPVEVHRGTYCLHLQGWRVSQTSGQQEVARYLPHAVHLFGFLINREDGDSTFLRSGELLLRLQGVTSLKIVVFIGDAVKPPNSTVIVWFKVGSLFQNFDEGTKSTKSMDQDSKFPDTDSNPLLLMAFLERCIEIHLE